jgi:hypothetical protein
MGLYPLAKANGNLKDRNHSIRNPTSQIAASQAFGTVCRSLRDRNT